MKNNSCGRMVSSVISTVIFFNSLISYSRGYGLLSPFNEVYYPDDPFFELRSGYWMYACLFSSDCKEFHRGLANYFGYGLEWYYDTCDISDGNDGLPDRPIRCKRIIKPFGSILLNQQTVPPNAPVNKFLEKDSEYDGPLICSECSKDQYPTEGFTSLFYIQCDCAPGCWAVDIQDVEGLMIKLRSHLKGYACYGQPGQPAPSCDCYLKKANWSSKEIKCLAPIYNCTSDGDII